MEYTAKLNNWFYNKKMNVLVGDIEGDKRFPDGSKVQTSRLRPMSEQVSTPKEGAVMLTMNSSYLLGEKG